MSARGPGGFPCRASRLAGCEWRFGYCGTWANLYSYALNEYVGAVDLYEGKTRVCRPGQGQSPVAHERGLSLENGIAIMEADLLLNGWLFEFDTERNG